MNAEERHYNRTGQVVPRIQFKPPDIPESEWCDFRKDYESGMTLVEIGAKYYCDPRTVKACIMHNKSSSMLGSHSVPDKLASYRGTIDSALRFSSGRPSHLSISEITREIFHMIREQGYDGCERTVRNYIDGQLKSISILKGKEQRDDPNCTY